jgi:PAS domain S-box-containing protein
MSPDADELEFWAGGHDPALLALVEAGSDGIVVIDRTGQIQFVNRRTEGMFGYERQELLGRAVETLVPPVYAERHAAERAGYFSDARERPMGRGLDLWGRRRDGTQFPIDVALVPLQTQRGQYAAAVIRDLADLVVLGRRLVNLLSELGEDLGTYIGARRGPPDHLLTARELEVLTLAARGLSSRDISKQLTVSPSTVKTHLEHVYAKLDVSDRAAAVARAMRIGLLH